MAGFNHAGYRIESADNCWVLGKERERTRDGETVTVVDPISYPATFPLAIKALAERLHRESDAEGLEAVAESYREITRDLLERLDMAATVREAAEKAVASGKEGR